MDDPFPICWRKIFEPKKSETWRETPAQQRPNDGSYTNTNQTTQKKRKKFKTYKLNILIDMHIKTFDTKTKGQIIKTTLLLQQR